MTIEEREAKLRAVLDEYGPRIRGGVRALVSNVQDVEDIVSEINLALWASLPKFNGSSSIGTYIYAITRNKIMDYLRRKYQDLKVRETALEALIAAPAEPMQEEIQTLSLRQSELRVLRLLARGLRNDEIAEALFLSRNTIRTHIKSIYRKTGARSRVEAAIIHNRCAGIAPGEGG